MQESELDNPALGDSQEWLDVSQDQVTEAEVTATTVETSHSEGAIADQAVTAVQQPEVMGMMFYVRVYCIVKIIAMAGTVISIRKF